MKLFSRNEIVIFLHFIIIIMLIIFYFADKDDSKEWLNKWGYSSKAPNFPHYSSFEVRLSSYDSWPETMKVTPQALSEAGFFYLGE